MKQNYSSTDLSWVLAIWGFITLFSVVLCTLKFSLNDLAIAIHCQAFSFRTPYHTHCPQQR
jgi:hypothetical protein